MFNEAALNVDKMNLYELFINMYLQEVRQLVKRGIKSEYIEQTDNVRYYKGKLLVSPHIKTNLAHKERFFVSYEEFHLDRVDRKQTYKSNSFETAEINCQWREFESDKTAFNSF